MKNGFVKALTVYGGVTAGVILPTSLLVALLWLAYTHRKGIKKRTRKACDAVRDSFTELGDWWRGLPEGERAAYLRHANDFAKGFQQAFLLAAAEQRRALAKAKPKKVKRGKKKKQVRG